MVQVEQHVKAEEPCRPAPEPIVLGEHVQSEDASAARSIVPPHPAQARPPPARHREELSTRVDWRTLWRLDLNAAVVKQYRIEDRRSQCRTFGHRLADDLFIPDIALEKVGEGL